MPRRQPTTPSAPARKPSGTEPASPMNMRAGGKLNDEERRGRGGDRGAQRARTRRRRRASAATRIGAEPDHGHAAGEPVGAVHEVVEVRIPGDGKREHREQHRLGVAEFEATHRGSRRKVRGEAHERRQAQADRRRRTPPRAPARRRASPRRPAARVRRRRRPRQGWRCRRCAAPGAHAANGRWVCRAPGVRLGCVRASRRRGQRHQMRSWKWRWLATRCAWVRARP